jgi:hypothetical protein
MLSLVESTSPLLVEQLREKQVPLRRYLRRYMRALARHLSNDRHLSLVTDDDTHAERCPREDNKRAFGSNEDLLSKDTQTVAHYAMPIPDVRHMTIQDLLAFRKDHRRELIKLRRLIDQLGQADTLTARSWHRDHWYSSLEPAVDGLFKALGIRRGRSARAVLMITSAIGPRLCECSSTAASTLVDRLGGGSSAALVVVNGIDPTVGKSLGESAVVLFNADGTRESPWSNTSNIKGNPPW